MLGFSGCQGWCQQRVPQFACCLIENGHIQQSLLSNRRLAAESRNAADEGVLRRCDVFVSIGERLLIRKSLRVRLAHGFGGGNGRSCRYRSGCWFGNRNNGHGNISFWGRISLTERVDPKRRGLPHRYFALVLDRLAIANYFRGDAPLRASSTAAGVMLVALSERSLVRRQRQYFCGSNMRFLRRRTKAARDVCAQRFHRSACGSWCARSANPDFSK